MFRKMSIVGALLATTVLGAASSAFAGDFVAVQQDGWRNRAAVDTEGDCNYLSARQAGSRNSLRSSVAGYCNAQISGHQGSGNSLESEVDGVGNGLGVEQEANGTLGGSSCG
jgi:hypothetical protein